VRILFLEDHAMWIHGLPNGFRKLGHKVKTYSPDSNTKRIINRFQPDFIMTIGWTEANGSAKKQLQIAKAVKHSCVPHVYWSTEDPGYTQSFSLPLIRRIKPDFVFTIHRPTVKLYRKLSIPTAHLDFGFDPSVHRRAKVHKKYRSTAALVANGYVQLYRDKPKHYRFQTLRHLVNPFLKKNLKINFYGRYWDQMRHVFKQPIPKHWIRGYLPYTKANKVYSSVDFVIGPQNGTDRLTQRTYEVLASGGLLITSDTPEVRKLFRPGRDLLVSASEKKTRKLIKKYLRLPKKRERIRRNAIRTVRSHSYKNRASYILRVLRKHQII